MAEDARKIGQAAAPFGLGRVYEFSEPTWVCAPITAVARERPTLDSIFEEVP